MDPGAEQFARLARFTELVAGDPRLVPLDQTALAIAAVLRSTVDVDGALATLDELAGGCGHGTFDGLRRYLFDDLAFIGDRTSYDDPNNSLLDLVLARRTGLPILLATVMMEVGRRAGTPVLGIGMPMHFMVRDAVDPEAFADPFTGEALDRHGVQQRFEAMAQGRMRWDERHLEPANPRQIVVRMLSNLRVSYERRHDPLRQALVARMRVAIPELRAEAPSAARLGAFFN
jgi:regulator of sirC expression with transglutaminase-like and TPR domain